MTEPISSSSMLSMRDQARAISCRKSNRLLQLIFCSMLALLKIDTCSAQHLIEAGESGADRDNSTPWAVYGQLTNITQQHNNFPAPYSGTNSLMPQGGAQETTDATLFLGRRLWQGAEVWINGELDQGFGLSNTLGVAGFPNGGAYKIGANTPYFRIPRLFLRQVIGLSGAGQPITGAPNQLAGISAENQITLTAGKLAVTDIFDTNSYAHDPRADFLNWAILDGGAFDYAADPWSYTYGAAVEWTENWWTLRAGWFQLSPVPNGKITHIDFSGNESVLEAEARHKLLGRDGKVKLLLFLNHGNMGSYEDALKLAASTGGTPQTALVRHSSSRPGVVLNAEQEITDMLSGFARISASRGDKETYEFSDIDQSTLAGLSLNGSRWSRTEDVVGIAIAANHLSGAAQHYFAAGGLGLLIGDGQLHYAPEKILETYYAAKLSPSITVTLDYQYVANPGYNRDRGPVSVYGLRMHTGF